MALDILPFQRILAKHSNVSSATPLALVPEEGSSERPTSPQLREAWRLLNASRSRARPLNSIFIENVLDQTHDDAEEIVMKQAAILQNIEAGVYEPEHIQHVESQWKHLRKRGKAKKRRRKDQLRAMLEADAVAAENDEDEAVSQARNPGSLPPIPPRYLSPNAPSRSQGLKYSQRQLASAPDLVLRHPRGSPRKLHPISTLRRRQVKLVEQLDLNGSEVTKLSMYDRSYEDELLAFAKKRQKEKEEAAARTIQIRWRYFRLRHYLLLMNATLACAAEVIQYWWRIKLEQRATEISRKWLPGIYASAESKALSKTAARRLSNDILSSVYSSTIADISPKHICDESPGMD